MMTEYRSPRLATRDFMWSYSIMGRFAKGATKKARIESEVYPTSWS
jgi:hypothetical protein